MTRIDELMKTNELQDRVDDLLAKLDAAMMQVIGVADLAKQALENELEGAESSAIYALDAIRSIAATASTRIDETEIEISEARIRDAAARESVASGMSPFGHVAPL